MIKKFSKLPRLTGPEKMNHHPAVDDYLAPGTSWEEPLAALRELLLAAGLREEFKWRAPCYCLDNANVALLGRLRDHCVLSFMRGAELENPDGLLRAPGEHSRSVRLLSFTRRDQVEEIEPTIKRIIANAIAVQQAGPSPRNTDSALPPYPAELSERFRQQPELEQAFLSLTTGRQRAYLIHFSGAKQSSSRADRIERYAARILAGKGFHDCVCGHSKRMPRCDGSHKEFDR